MRLQHSRRSTDQARVHRQFVELMATVARAWDPVAGGQLMLLTNGIMIVLTLPMLDPHRWQTAAVEVALTTGLGWAVSLFMPWHRLPRRATLAFPLFAWTALGLLGLTNHGLASSYTGLFVLWFAYIGLTHGSGAGVALLPFAVVSWVGTWGSWTTTLIPRLVVVVAVWLMLSELLAALIERQRVLTDEMRQLAHIDTLTNLANRRDLDLRMAEARPGDTVVLCDLDHFKNLNDTLGHAAGDEVLAEFGLVIRASLRQLDYAARYGGEEFALLLPATSEQQAVTILARLRQRWSILQPTVTFSAGVAMCRPEQGPAQTLLEADQALYAAKAAGRNQDHTRSGVLGAPPAASLV
jgi:diguanylate cyclase (GGDEF)-like protein